ncbi:MAG: TRAP transporter large permease [Dehalococcoidales bacterium]|nr:TRAP transporter large permease [Dehalococcoidales bacterium]
MEIAWPLQAGLIFLALITLIILGMPIAFSLGLVSLAGIFIFMGPPALQSFGHVSWTTINSFVFAAVPLFFLMSEIITFTGMSGDVFNAMHKWLQWLPGGLAVVSVMTCAIFGAVSGTGVGVAAIVGSVAVPQMLKYKYDGKLATGAVAASSALGMVIPPSIPFILYGAVTETSVGKMFIAGILPGLIVTALYATYIISAVKIKPTLAPLETVEITWKERFSSLTKILPIAALIVLIIGGMYGGIYTPTEAAAIGAVGAGIIAALFRKLTWRNLWKALTSATRVTSMTMFIVIGAMLFGFLLTGTRIGLNLSTWVVSLDVSRWIIFLIFNLIWLILGCFIDVGSIVLITMPIFFPIAKGLGFDPVWFGVVCMINMCAAVVTPPLGLCAFVVHSIAPEIPLSDIFKAIIPYLCLIAFAIILFSIFPQIITVLPNAMFAAR